MAVQDPETGEWILNGSKIFITNAGYANVYVIIAMTDKSKGLKGISAFIVEANTPGFSIGKKEMKLGIRGSSTCELIFENCRIPKENLLLVYKAAWRESNNLPYSLDAARAKLFAAETAMEVTTKAVQIFGGYGYTREYPVERMMRDAKITEIYEGTSEVQRMVIAANVIK